MAIVPAFALGGVAFFVFVCHWFAAWFVGTTKRVEYLPALSCTTAATTVVATLVMGKSYYARQIVLTTIVVVWAVRLGSFVTFRHLRNIRAGRPADARLSDLMAEPVHLFLGASLMGAYVFMCTLPVIIVNGLRKDAPIATLDIVGWALWAVGLFLASAADAQKLAFHSTMLERRKWISNGLWRFSAGEIMCWVGLYLSSLSVLGWGWVPLFACPMVSWGCLTTLSGVPLLDKINEARWGTVFAYRQYQRSTNLLMPWFPGPRDDQAGTTPGL